MNTVTLNLAGQKLTVLLDGEDVCLAHGTVLVEVKSLVLPCGQLLEEAELLDLVKRKLQEGK